MTHGSKYNRGLWLIPVKPKAGFWLAGVSSPKYDSGTQAPSTLWLVSFQCEDSNVSVFNCIKFTERGKNWMMGGGQGAAYFPSPLQGRMFHEGRNLGGMSTPSVGFSTLSELALVFRLIPHGCKKAAIAPSITCSHCSIHTKKQKRRL